MTLCSRKLLVRHNDKIIIYSFIIHTSIPYRFWFTKFGHVGPYKETIVKNSNGEIVDVIPSGNTMEAPGNINNSTVQPAFC